MDEDSSRLFRSKLLDYLSETMPRPRERSQRFQTLIVDRDEDDIATGDARANREADVTQEIVQRLTELDSARNYCEKARP